MTRAEIKSIIIEDLNKLRARNYGASADRHYQMGKVAGMIKAFRLVGYDSLNGLYQEILDEEF